MPDNIYLFSESYISYTRLYLLLQESDIERSEVLSQCGHRCVNVCPALTGLSRQCRDAGGAGSTVITAMPR